MKRELWLERWKQGQIGGFHQREVHPALAQHWASLGVPAGATVFVPLCGKSLDMLWLRAQGHPILGVEFSEIAVRDFFAEHGMTPEVSKQGRLDAYTADGVTLLCGDYFDVTPAQLRGVGGVYDRASIVALPPDVRERYVEHLGVNAAKGTKVLLVTMSYPAGEIEGPPFSVTEQEVKRLYGGAFEIEAFPKTDAMGGNAPLRQRGLTELHEQVFRMTRR